MPEITGRLLAELHPNGTVRIVFIAHTGGGNECPMTAKSLDTAEIDFARMCGLTPERASALRTELDRNKAVSFQTSIDDAVKAKFRYAGPGGCVGIGNSCCNQWPFEVGKGRRYPRPGIIGSRAVPAQRRVSSPQVSVGPPARIHLGWWFNSAPQH